MLGSLAVAVGCAGSTLHDSGTGGDGYGAAFEGDGVQCGAVICSGSQVCCIVPIPTEASSMGPAGKCDESCESVCADSCPDAGSTSMRMPGGGGGMQPGASGGNMMMPGNSPNDAMAGGMMMPGNSPNDAMTGGMMMPQM